MPPESDRLVHAPAGEWGPALALLPLAATLAYYVLPASLQTQTFIQFAPQLLAYAALFLWASRNSADPRRLRERLLAVRGVGRETADSIALYATGHPLFVVDAYTRRVSSRLGLLAGGEPYDDVKRFFMDALPRDPALHNDFHAQIVRLAKDVCRPRPRCTCCPLEDLCPSSRGSDPEGLGPPEGLRYTRSRGTPRSVSPVSGEPR